MTDLHTPPPIDDDDDHYERAYRRALSDPEFAALRAADLEALTPQQQAGLPAQDRAWLASLRPPPELNARILATYTVAVAESAVPATAPIPHRDGRRRWRPRWRDLGVALPTAAISIAATLLLAPGLHGTLAPPPQNAPFIAKNVPLAIDPDDPGVRLHEIAKLLQRGEYEPARKALAKFRNDFPQLFE